MAHRPAPKLGSMTEEPEGPPTRRERLRRVVEEDETPFGRGFDWIVQATILGYLALFTISTLPELSATQLAWVLNAEHVLVGFFVVEYLLRLAVSRPPWRYVLSWYGLIDLLAILPTLVTLGVDLRAGRAVRLLAALRLLKLVQSSRAVRRFGLAFRLVRDELTIYMGATLLLLYFSAVGIYVFEHEAQPEKFASIPHSLWWSVVTLTTVGYGDVVPVTTGGRVFTLFVLMLGIGVVSVPSAMLASALTKAREIEARRRAHHRGRRP